MYEQREDDRSLLVDLLLITRVVTIDYRFFFLLGLEVKLFTYEEGLWIKHEE